MPALATSLTEYSDESNSRTYTVSGHTVAKPKLVLQKRKVGTPGAASSVDDLQVIFGAADASGAILPGRIAFTISVRRPVEAVSADTAAALAVVRDIVASDEFAAMVNTQNYIKA